MTTAEHTTIDIAPDQDIYKSLLAALNSRESARAVIRSAGEDLRVAEQTILELVSAAYPEDSAGHGIHVMEMKEGLQILLFPPPVAVVPLIGGGEA